MKRNSPEQACPTCPECGGEVQATREEWLSFRPEGTIRLDYTFRAYCENDHELDDDDDITAWLEARISEWDRAHTSGPMT